MAKNSKKTSKTNSTWTVRGVTLDTRSAVKVAARRSGKTLGEWLEETLSTSARKDSSHNNVPAPRIEDTLTELIKTMQAQNQRLDKIEQRKGFLNFIRYQFKK